MSNATWEGWGNWTQHPWLAIMDYMKEAPILFNLKYVGKPTSADNDLVITILAVGIAFIAVTIATLVIRSWQSKRLHEKKE
jgi:hypothetical protein